MKKYCCLDIETSDFDPQTGEILELGMVFFTVAEDRIVFEQEWTSVFHAAKPVSPRILALTNINQDELDDAPRFSEKAEEVQELLKDRVIVGHNISFDTGFLEAFGIVFGPDRLDTLDLAQFILPTVKTYNLEALMGIFSIHFKNAHRALADAKATVAVLESMLRVFAAFPEDLRDGLRKLYAKGDANIQAMLATSFAPLPFAPQRKIQAAVKNEEVSAALREGNCIVTFPLGSHYHANAYAAAKNSPEKTLLVVGSEAEAYRAWESGLGYPLFEARTYFDEKKFARQLKAPADNQGRLFLAKLLVWKSTDWQSEVLTSVNLSFFGNKYRQTVAGKQNEAARAKHMAAEKTLIMDYDSFIRADVAALADRHALIFDLNNFESALTRAVNRKAAWNDFTYAITELIDTENDEAAKQPLRQALAETDLFFGLAMMNIRNISRDAQNLLVDEQVRDSQQLQTVQKAAENYLKKIETIPAIADSERVSRLSAVLRSFFEASEGHVYWIEISVDRMSFHSSPISLTEITAEKLNPFGDNITFLASLGSPALLAYFRERLGLERYSVRSIGMQELRGKFTVQIVNKIFDEQAILDLIPTLDYPAALLLPNMTAIQNFYEKNFGALRDSVRLWVQNYSGSTNKLLENFGIEPRSLFVATDRFVLKNPNRGVTVKSLIITRLPFEQFTHPLAAAQGKRYANAFEEFSIPRALHNFHTVISFFYGPELQKIYIADPKIHKEYGKYFIDYLQSLPFVDIEYV